LTHVIGAQTSQSAYFHPNNQLSVRINVSSALSQNQSIDSFNQGDAPERSRIIEAPLTSKTMMYGTLPISAYVIESPPTTGIATLSAILPFSRLSLCMVRQQIQI
jgi:hypothetical protein